MSKSSNISYQVSNIPPPSVAIVHDWLYGGGAELVVEELHKLYPEAPIYTSYCSDEWRERLNNKVVTGYLQRWPFAPLRKFLPVLRQHWFKNLNLSNFDLVISSCGNGEARFALSGKKSSHAASSNIKYQISNMDTPRPLHISYTHTPTHFYWRKYSEYLKNPSFRPKWLVRIGLKLLVKPLRKRDYQAAQSVDYFIANSSHIQNDIKKYYDRDSTVIHPPVNIESFTNTKRQIQKDKSSNSVASSNINYQTSNMDTPRPYVIWGRHVPYKRFDLAIRACNQLKLPLTVVGSGPETEALKMIAGPTITFTGRLPHDELVDQAVSAEAFLFPGEEDFGIAPVEALALGVPVIAFRSGGALDYIEPGKTGVFFEEQTVESLVEAIETSRSVDFKPDYITKSTEVFSAKEFAKQISAFIASKMETGQ